MGLGVLGARRQGDPVQRIGAQRKPSVLLVLQGIEITLVAIDVNYQDP